MTNTLRNIALQTTIVALGGLIALNAYLVSKNLAVIKSNAAHRVEASETIANISSVLIDLQDMETSQRGYLLTGDASYLQRYEDANARSATHFAKLRSTLTGKDRSLETQLESLAESKVAEMNETIRLRERGYRHRAFQIVGSNRGKQLMDEARATLDALSSAQASNVARYDRDLTESAGRAMKESIIASCVLLVVTVVTFLVFDMHRRRLERGYTRRQEELQATSLQLEQFTSTVFQGFRPQLEEMRGNASMLVGVYGGFLPRQGQEKAERIEDGAGQMICLLEDLSKNSASGNSAEAGDMQQLSA